MATKQYLLMTACGNFISEPIYPSSMEKLTSNIIAARRDDGRDHDEYPFAVRLAHVIAYRTFA